MIDMLEQNDNQSVAPNVGIPPIKVVPTENQTTGPVSIPTPAAPVIPNTATSQTNVQSQQNINPTKLVQGKWYGGGDGKQSTPLKSKETKIHTPSDFNQQASGEDISNEQEEEDVTENDNSTLKVNPIAMIIVGAIVVLLLIAGVAYVMNDQKKKESEQALVDAEYYEQQIELNKFKYDAAEKDALRLAGYTADEIEQYEKDAIPADGLVESAAAARKAQYEEEIRPYYEGASPEFKAMYEKSWVGLPELEITGDINTNSYKSTTMNLDYEKLPATGMQCFIKVYLTDGSPFFITVTPERYLSLNDKGNIVLKIDYTVMPNSKKVITNVVEVTP